MLTLLDICTYICTCHLCLLSSFKRRAGDGELTREIRSHPPSLRIGSSPKVSWFTLIFYGKTVVENHSVRCA